MPEVQVIRLGCHPLYRGVEVPSDSSDGHGHVYRWEGERYADACVVQRLSFGGGSVMVWKGITAHHRTQLEVINCNLTGIRYCDEEVLHSHVLQFLQFHGCHHHT